MRAQERDPEATDDAFLDALFERLVAALEDGASPSIPELLDGRAHLHGAAEALLFTARNATGLHARELPRVRGYALLGEIGRGGMGTVYLARQESLGGRRVALKVLPASAGLSPRARERFLVEARALASLKHPSVVTVYDVVADAGAHAYSMEWVEGASLGRILDELERREREARARGEPVAAPAIEDVRAVLGPAADPAAASYPVFVARVGVAIARALGALHAAGLVHRDVKPSNVLLRRDGTALLSDFGLVHASAAELTQSGLFAGTVAYASPEQLEGAAESLDARSDVYALGVTLYRALSLHLPYESVREATRPATTPSGMLKLIEAGRATPLRAWNRQLPRDLETIVAKATEREPARRYASAYELADDLERMLALQPIRARPAGWLARGAKLVRRQRAAAIGLGAGSALSLVLGSALVVQQFLAPRWAEHHAREARLALLDPEHANALFNVEFYGLPADTALAPRLRDAALDEALRQYAVALRWAPFDAALRAESDVVAAVRAGGTAAPPSGDAGARARLAGLASYLRGEVDAAVRSWEQFEAARPALADADALVEAALGCLYVVRDEPARAYPRLRLACQAFPSVAFLTTYLADAATRCGDLDVAEDLLVAARAMPRPDPMGAGQRVLADLRAAQGRDREAEELYRARNPLGPTTLSLARFLQARGRREEALATFLAVGSVARGHRVRRECQTAIEAWWSALPPRERRRALRAALDEDPLDPRAFVGRLALCAEPEPALAPRPGRSTGAGVDPRGPRAAPRTLGARDSSHSLQNRSLADLARTLEVHDMSRWNLIHSYSPLFKELQLRAWSSPAPRSASRALSTVALWLRPRATRLAFGGAVASAMSALGVAQNCPNPPCFQGLGDLPGGTVYSTALCLSTDGTHVGGGSATSASAPPYNFEAFVWTDAGGMVGIGDLPGNLTAGHTYAFSADGAIAVGWSSSGASTTYPYTEAFRWTQAGGMTGLGDIPGGTTFSQARGISDDGVLVVGHAFPGSTPRAATWSSATGWIAQGAPGTTSNAFVGGSRDGQWACGDDYTSGATLAARWSEFLGWEVIPGTTAPSTGSSVSDNGIVVGYENHSGGNCGAFLWTGSGSSQPLPDLAGGANFAIAEAILRDGSLIVGSGTTGAGPEAVLWDESRSAHRIADVLAGAGVSIPAGWLLTDVQDIVRNGNVITICGNGTNPSGNIEGWIARFDGYPTELFCFGDGTGTACPCANNSPVGNDDGCLNSLGSGGRLRVSGTADLSADTLALLGSQMPNSFALFFQGSTLSGGGNGTLFGDGLRCAGGIIRLGTKQNVGGGSQYPVAGDPSVSVRGLVTAPGGWRYYQTWYRNAAAFCTASTFNLTNAARVFWVN